MSVCADVGPGKISSLKLLLSFQLTMRVNVFQHFMVFRSIVTPTSHFKPFITDSRRGTMSLECLLSLQSLRLHSAPIKLLNLKIPEFVKFLAEN